MLAAMLCLAVAAPCRAADRQVLHGHVPQMVSQLAPVGRLAATQRLHIAIGLPLRNQQSLNELLRQLYDPASPNYRHYLTPAQFTARFGPARQDYEAVATFAEAHGLSVSGKSSNRVVLDVDGAVSDIEKALNVTLRLYRHPTESRDFYAPDTEPSLDLATPIAHISGLDNLGVPKPAFKKRAANAVASATPSTGSGPSGTYMGYDFRAAYAPGVSLTGSGQTIGLLEFDGYTASDITYYEDKMGVPTVSVTNVLLDSFNGTPTNIDDQTEVSLDIEMDIAMAFGVSQIIVYEAGPNGNFDDILNRMVTDNLAKQISSSWFETGVGDDSTADSDFEEMAMQGQSFYQASGDSDAYTSRFSGIPFPCDNPYITIVGGTTLTDSGTGGPWISETVWNWDYDSNAGGYVGSGGGISSIYSIPTWQIGVATMANKASASFRNIPDVALTANNVDVRISGSNSDVGGTSCAAPLWAAFTALVNQQSVAAGEGTVGFINPAVYSISTGTNYTTDFHDITTGNNFNSSRDNTKYAATTGYDLCTGLGTPTGSALINALAPPPQPVPVITSATNVTATEGQQFTYQITGTNSPTNYNATGLPTSFNLSATGLISGTWTASGTDTFTVSAINTGGTGSALVTALVQTPYAAWQSQIFTSGELSNPAISGDGADPAGDGIPNLMKYALNLNPWTDGVSGLPVESIVTTGNGNFPTLTYTQVLAATDVTYTVQVSTDLLNWFSGATYTTPLSATLNPGGLTESVTVQSLVPVDGNTPKQFIRLQVNGP